MPKSPWQLAEWNIFKMARNDAKEHAERGERAAGYACLLAGLQRMEEFVTGGEAWADELLKAYRSEATQFQQAPGTAAPRPAGKAH
jgi:hypothetical protein